AVDLLRDRGVDELCLLLRVVVRGAPDELDALVLGRLLSTLLDHRPEGALVAVGDHGEGQAAALGEGDVVLVRGRGALAALVLARVPAARSDERQGHQQSETDEQSSHGCATSLSGASVVRYSMLLLTSRTGPSPSGGSSPVMAVSCSSTSQRSYPLRSSR